MRYPLMFKYSVLVIVLLLIFSCNEENKNEPKQRVLPNIIWLVAEDQSPDFFPMYGDSTISLTNLEALANDAVVFDNAYSPVPVCAPARSSIITGMYPTTLGTHNMRTYAPWTKGNQPEIGVPNYSPIVPDGVKMFTEYLRKEGYYCANGPKEDYNFEKTNAAWDESTTDRHWRNRREGQPFFTVFNFAVCHESQIWNRGKDSLFVDPMKVPVPSYFPDNDIIRHDLAVNYSNLKRLDDQVGEIIEQLKEDGLYENSIIFFYGDHGGPFPRYKRALYETGLKVPMFIKFPENENAGSRDDRLISFIDLAPTVLSLAGIDPPKVMQGVAQFGEYEVAKKPKYSFHSSDRFDELYDRLRAVRSGRYKYIKNFDVNISNALPVAYREQMPMMKELRRLYANGELNAEQSLWFKTPKPEEELYDLELDPYELNNLAEIPAMKDTLVHLREVLHEWIFETSDLGQIPELELIEKWLPKGEQPQLPSLEMNVVNDKINLYSAKTDATIIWKLPKDSIWNVYKTPLTKDASFQAKSERIGYEASEVLEYVPE